MTDEKENAALKTLVSQPKPPPGRSCPFVALGIPSVRGSSSSRERGIGSDEYTSPSTPPKSQAVAPLCRQAAQQLAAYSITLDVPIIPSRPSVSPFENGNRKKKSRKSNPSALERYPARPGPGPYQSAVIPKLELFLSCRAGRPVQPNGTGAERFEKREEWQLAILALHPSPIEITHVGCCCCCWEERDCEIS